MAGGREGKTCRKRLLVEPREGSDGRERGEGKGEYLPFFPSYTVLLPSRLQYRGLLAEARWGSGVAAATSALVAAGVPCACCEGTRRGGGSDGDG